MVLHYGTPLPKAGEEAAKRPTTVEELKEIFSIDSLRADIYQFWGYRFDFKESEAKNAKKIHDRLMTEIPQSLTEQRERLLDLVDGIVGAIVEESCPPTSRRRTGTGRASARGSSSTSATKPMSTSST